MRVLGLGTVAVIALATRLYAVDVLPIDFDEDDYVRAGQQYAAGLQTGDLDVFLRDNYRTEHPPLSKIVTGIALAPLPASEDVPDRPTTAGPAASLPEPQFTVARTVQAVFGALTATLLAVISPLGAFWLAIHTWSIKYTSQVMLEAIPAFFALAAVMAYAIAARAGPRGRRIGLIAAAGKAFELTLDNQDGAPHNVAIYTDSTASTKVSIGEIFGGPGQRTQSVPALTAGTYFFRCDVHQNMTGTIVAK